VSASRFIDKAAESQNDNRLEDNEVIDEETCARCKLRIVQNGDTESVWASVLSDGVYRLENLLFHTYGYAYADVVSAAKQANDDLPLVSNVVRRSGHSAYRVFLSEELDGIEQVAGWGLLHSLRCTYERASTRLFAIDVPPTADIQEVYSALQAGETAGEWEFEEVFCGHPVKQKSTI
jgi:hypothetical protein